MADLAERLAGLTQEERAALARKLAARSRKPAAVAAIPRLPEGAIVPLAAAQRRLWLLDRLVPNRAVYNVPIAVRLAGLLDAALLGDAWAAIVARYAILRTAFILDGDEPTPTVMAGAAAPLRVVRVEGTTGEARVREAERLARAEGAVPFDLALAPLVRATLYRIDADDHLLVLALHHIVADGWTVDLLLDELSTRYDALARGTDEVPAAPAIAYADYAAWHRAQEDNPSVAAGIAFWREHLRDAPPVLALPTDRLRPALQEYDGALVRHLIAPDLMGRLRGLARAAGATPFMVVAAAFNVLLGRWSGQDDLLVATPVAGRSRPELETVVGSFVNTVVLRTDLAGNPSFREALARTREAILAAHAHDGASFEAVVEAVAPARDPGYPPLCQVLVAQQVRGRGFRAAGIDAAPSYTLDNGTAKFDLSLYFADDPQGLALNFEYNSALFDAATIARFAAQFATMLAAIADDPDRPIGLLPILPAEERHQLLVAPNQTAMPLPKPATLPALLAAALAATPDAVAVVGEGGETLTYRELHERANRLAHHLRARGVGSDTLVAVCFERSPLMIVALLGVLGAGGAYLPLDPAYPPDRVGYMLEDGGAAIVLTEEAIVAGLPPTDAALLRLDADWPTIAAESAEPPPCAVGSDDLAYVIYTSGSTGKPKGVQIPQRAIVNFLLSMAQAPGFGRDDTLVAVTTLAFDIAALELFLPLTTGGRVVIADRATATDGARLAALLAKSNATVMQATPATWRLLLAAGWAGSPRLRALCGGEAMPRDLAEALLPRVGALWNLYGPTETTVWSLARRVEPGAGPVPIGGPLANTVIYIQDRNGQPAPLGVPGELFIGGAGVARSYRGRPDLTAERFLPDPFMGEAGARLYRTGDLARWRPDGTIEFLGRGDGQIKLRGYRIELGEIEAALLTHPAIGACAVALVGDADPRLVAFLVAPLELNDTDRPEGRDLRGHLKGALPDYMLPSAYTWLDALPLTPNGKVDRRALPALVGIDPPVVGADEPFAAPTTPVEEVLAGIWSLVLGLDQVGVRDNFFELGGHSLLATRVVSRIRGLLHVDLPVRAIFEAPTVAELAARIAAMQCATGQGPQGAPLLPVARTAPPALSFAQQRLWFLDQMEPNNPFYTISVGYRLTGPLQLAALEQSFNAIVRRHETLRTTIVMVEGEPVQIIAPEMIVPLDVVDLRHLPAAEREGAAAMLTSEAIDRPFDLAAGPLVRATLAQLADEEHLLLVTIHHSVSDAWSMRLFAQELGALYGAYAAGRDATLPELPIQYADYALWQRAWLRGQAEETLLAYWRERLAGASRVLELPTDHPRPAVQTFRGARQTVRLPRSLTLALRDLSRREGATLFMTVLVAFQTLLSRYSGQESIVVGVPVANRDHAEVERLIGLFVNTLAVHTDLAGDPTFRALLGRVREGALGDYAHQELPFERLVEELQPARDLSRNPLFQVLFVFHDGAEGSLPALPGIAVETAPIESAVAKFDLTLAIEEIDGELTGLFEYATDLFAAATIARMADHLRTLLEAVVADPESRLSALPLLTTAERQQLLVAWNDTARDFPRDRCVHEAVLARAALTPDAVAISFEDEHLTYGELAARAARLARHLQARGVGPEVPVGLCVERSIEMVVGLLGILAAGGAYLPLDPAYPPDRLAYMLADSGTPIVLTQARLRDQLPAHDAEVVCLDADWPTIAAESAELPACAATADNLAYILYTSGSTGRPKGVEIPHRAFVNFLSSMARTPGFGPDDTMLAVTTLSFDIAGLELFLPLVAGGRVMIASREVAVDGPRLSNLLERSGATVMQATPATWRLLLAAGWAGSLRLRALCGGEALPRDLAEALLPRVGALWNLYGPTETTVWSLAQRVEPGTGPVPIGGPIDNTVVYLLDRGEQPVPIGVSGEVYIGGAGVARGYRGRPDLTAARFLPDPFTSEPGARMYRTGDLARWRPDGTIEFLGRLDQQVKLRGFRIELGEIEAALATHPAVRESAVALVGDDDPRLVAFLVAPEGTASTERPEGRDLRSHLKGVLPDYMLPSAYTWLDALPLTPNGKVDRRALPTASADVANAANSMQEARDELERQLVAIWEATLGVAPIGVADNFFELGGHSLIAVRLFARLEAAFGHKLPLATLFAAPTIAELADLLRREGWAASWSSLVPLQPRGDRPPFFCVHAIGGNVLKFQALAARLGPDQPLYGLQARGLDGQEAPRTRVEEMATHYLSEIRSVQLHGPYFLGGQCFGGMVALEMARQLQADGERVALLAMFDDYAPGYDKLLSPAKRARLRARWLVGRGTHHLATARGLGLAAMPGYVGQRAATIARRLRSLLWAARARRYDEHDGGLPQELRDVREAHRRAQRAYVPGRFTGKPTLFMVDFSKEFLPDPDPLWGWGGIASDGVAVHQVPGDHDSLWEEPHVATLAEKLRAAIDAAR